MTSDVSSRYRFVGLGLVAIACVGFLTVADEFRHLGEFFGVIGILISGIAISLAGFFPRWSSIAALQWVAAGVGLGMVAGAATDRMVLGVCSGVLLGLILSFLMRRRTF